MVNTNISRYMRWLKEEKNLSFDSYEELWEWFVTALEGFWAHIGVLRRKGLEALRKGTRQP